MLPLIDRLIENYGELLQSWYPGLSIEEIKGYLQKGINFLKNVPALAKEQSNLPISEAEIKEILLLILKEGILV